MRNINMLAIAFVTVFLIGCSVNSSSEALEAEPFITGVIVQTEEGEVYTRILVEENTKVDEPSEPGGTKIWFTLTEDTEILLQPDSDTFSQLDEESLEIGQEVKGWAKGVVAESHPLQGSARRIVVF